MFCAGCGSQIQQGLNYCSRCGRRVADDAKAASVGPTMIAAYTGGVGFVSYIFVILIMSRSGVLPNLFVPITFFYFAALFGICFILLRQGSSAEKTTEQVDERKEPAYLQPANTAQLPPTSAEPASVTEHTTRTLNNVPTERG